MASYTYNVYLYGRLVDTVFACYKDSEEMRQSLINHDGYHPAIVVKLV